MVACVTLGMAEPMRTLRRRRGQSLVEFTLIAPILVMIVVIVLDLGPIFAPDRDVQGRVLSAASLRWISSAISFNAC